MIWFYNIGPGDVVHLQARAESGPMLGDLREELHDGEEIFGLSYKDLVAAGNGRIIVDTGGVGHIAR